MSVEVTQIAKESLVQETGVPETRTTQIAKEVLVTEIEVPEARTTQIAREALVTEIGVPEARSTQIARELLVTDINSAEVRSTQIVREVLLTYDLPNFSNTTVAHYTMDNVDGSTLYDETDQNNDATLSGIVQTPGLSGQGMLFDAVTDYIKTPLFSKTIMCASAFFRFDGSATWTTLFCRDGGGYHHCLIQSGTNLIGWYNNGWYSSGIALVPGTWYHIVVIKNGTNQKLYLDKVKIMDQASFSNVTYPLSMIGNYVVSGAAQGALGIIDNVKIAENYEWTAADVATLYEEIYIPEPSESRRRSALGGGGGDGRVL
jgi:hypothetical protein